MISGSQCGIAWSSIRLINAPTVSRYHKKACICSRDKIPQETSWSWETLLIEIRSFLPNTKLSVMSGSKRLSSVNATCSNAFSWSSSDISSCADGASGMMIQTIAMMLNNDRIFNLIIQ